MNLTSLRGPALGLAASLALAGTAQAVNIVTNGSFENLTAITPAPANSADVGHYGQLGYNTNADGWTSAAPNGSYNFVFNGSNADSGVPGQFGSLALWGPGNGVNNGLSASPDGGNFIAMDGAYNTGPVSQTLTGLTIGQVYTVKFYWAAAQQSGFRGDTEDSITVFFGSQSQTTTTFQLVDQGFSGWMQESFSFTATSASAALQFLANGAPPGLPPFALLDGVSIDVTPSAVPEPATLAILGAGLLGLGALRRRHR